MEGRCIRLILQTSLDEEKGNKGYYCDGEVSSDGIVLSELEVGGCGGHKRFYALSAEEFVPPLVNNF